MTFLAAFLGGAVGSIIVWVLTARMVMGSWWWQDDKQ